MIPVLPIFNLLLSISIIHYLVSSVVFDLRLWYNTCVTNVADYGADLARRWTLSTSLQAACQREACRMVFCSTEIEIFSSETDFYDWGVAIATLKEKKFWCSRK